jgi:MFS family permease
VLSSFASSRLAPFKNINFSLFFVVRTLSLVGRWSHELARAWLILELTGSSTWQGAVMLASAIPITLLILKGGALVDRADAKKIMLVTQFLMGILVLTLAAFCEWGDISVWHLIVFAAIEGVIISYDSPTFQAVVVRLVDKEDFQQAMAINSVNFHTGRMLGPVLAGALLTFWGPSLVFFVDAIGFFLVCIVTSFIKVKPQNLANTSKQKLSDLNYFWNNPKMRYQLGQLALSMVFIFPIFVVVLRTFATKKFDLEASEFGKLFMFPAMGSVFGSLFFAFWKPKNPLSAVKIGVPFTFVFYQLVVLSSTWQTAAVFMCAMGFSAYLMFAALTVGLQLDVQESFRGRVSALIGLAFGSLGPIFAFPVGRFSDSFGEGLTISLFSSLFFLTSMLWYFMHRSVFKPGQLQSEVTHEI